MKKLFAGVILFVVVAAVGSAYVTAADSSTVPAQVHVEDGSVSVNGQPVSGTVILGPGDIIRTGNGHATVILYESLLASLEPNSQVTVDELLLAHPQLSQQSGRTWSTFTKLSGVSSYSIKQGTSMASVRGTEFELSDRLLVVADGTVEYLFGGRTFTVTAGRSVQNGVERAATPAELGRVRAYRQRTLAELRYLRQLEIDKHPMVVSLATRSFSQGRLTQALDAADNGRFDIDAGLAWVPVRPASLVKVAAITKAIQGILRE